MAITARTAVVLEPAPQEVVDATSRPPILHEQIPAGTRKVVLDDIQVGPLGKRTVPAEAGDVVVRIVRSPPGIRSRRRRVRRAPELDDGGGVTESSLSRAR